MIDHEEVLQEFKLRKLIRQAIKIRQKKLDDAILESAREEEKLRKIIRTLLTEGEIDSDTNPAPYASTPVNALADAFNQILPIIKSGLRKLAKPEERESYRAHVLDKFNSIFSNFEGLDSQMTGVVGESDLTEQEEDKNKIVVNVDDPDRIVPDIEKDRFKEEKKDPDKQREDDFGEFRIQGEDPTGARVAFETIGDSNIEQVLSDKRKLLFTPEYKKQYKEYALYNIDLWMLTYEKELADLLGQEPAFTKTEMPRPAGAQEVGAAQEFGGEETAAAPATEAPDEQSLDQLEDLAADLGGGAEAPAAGVGEEKPLPPSPF